MVSTRNGSRIPTSAKVLAREVSRTLPSCPRHRQIRAQQCGIVRVVEGQQPVVLAGEPGLHRLDCRVEIGLRLDEPQLASDRLIRRSDRGFLFRRHPQHEPVMLPESVRVLDCGLGLTDPAQPMNRRLGKRGDAVFFGAVGEAARAAASRPVKKGLRWGTPIIVAVGPGSGANVSGCAVRFETGRARPTRRGWTPAFPRRKT